MRVQTHYVSRVHYFNCSIPACSPHSSLRNSDPRKDLVIKTDFRRMFCERATLLPPKSFSSSPSVKISFQFSPSLTSFWSSHHATKPPCSAMFFPVYLKASSQPFTGPILPQNVQTCFIFYLTLKTTESYTALSCPLSPLSIRMLLRHKNRLIILILKLRKWKYRNEVAHLDE